MANLLTKHIVGENPNAWLSAELSISFSSFATGSASNNGLFFKPDGTEMYVGIFGTTLKQYTLGTAWDVTSAGLTNTEAVTSPMQDVSFRESDGKKMYYVGGNKIREYDLSTGWDISTLGLVRDATIPTYMTGMYWKQDGTTVWFTNQTTELVYEYDVGTPWNISTLGFTQSIDVSAAMINAQCIFFKSDGTKMYINRTGIREFNLSVAWDISSAIWDTATDADRAASGHYWRSDGLKFYASTISSVESVKEYDII